MTGLDPLSEELSETDKERIFDLSYSIDKIVLNHQY